MSKKNLKKLPKSSKIFVYPLFFVLFVVGIDQLSKYLIIHISHLSYTINYGISFGMFSQGNYFPLYLIIIYSLFLIGLYLFTVSMSTHNYSLFLIIGGGVSNLIDRLYFGGGVIDWIPFFSLTTYNLADLAIFLSMVSLLYGYATSFIRRQRTFDH